MMTNQGKTVVAKALFDASNPWIDPRQKKMGIFKKEDCLFTPIDIPELKAGDEFSVTLTLRIEDR